MAQTLSGAGAVLDARAYDAYGKELAVRTPMGVGSMATDPFGFNAEWGYYDDRELGTYHCGAREYDPSTARWLERDPIGLAGGVNPYSYCGGNPVGNVDPEGLQRRTALIIMGDRSSGGDPLERMMVAGCKAQASMTVLFKSQGYQVRVLSNPSEALALRWLAKANACYFFGHGAGGTLVLNPDGESINAVNLEDVRAARRKNGMGMMDLTMLDACESLEDGVNGWYGISPFVYGHKGLMNVLGNLCSTDLANEVASPQPPAPSPIVRRKRKR